MKDKSNGGGSWWKFPCPPPEGCNACRSEEGQTDSTFKGDETLKQEKGMSRTRVKIKINFESETREVESSPYMASRIAVKQEVISSAEREGSGGLGIEQCKKAQEHLLRGTRCVGKKDKYEACQNLLTTAILEQFYLCFSEQGPEKKEVGV